MWIKINHFLIHRLSTESKLVLVVFDFLTRTPPIFETIKSQVDFVGVGLQIQWIRFENNWIEIQQLFQHKTTISNALSMMSSI